MPTLLEIDSKNIHCLSDRLKHIDHEDLYAVSPAYYALTGRKGLWIYSSNDTSMIISRHPNIDSTLLFFPPFGENKEQLISSALGDTRLSGEHVNLARIPPTYRSLARKFGPLERENRLDWTFPSHTLSPFLVSDLGGGYLKSFRQKVNQARGGGSLETIPINFSTDVDDVISIATLWAHAHVEKNKNIEELIDPVREILKFHSSLSLAGLMLVEKGKGPLGFTIWEHTRTKTGAASGLLKLLSRDFVGGSELLFYSQCVSLAEHGYKELCIGGAETKELDHFKRKMYPTRSVPLSTVFLKNRRRRHR